MQLRHWLRLPFDSLTLSLSKGELAQRGPRQVLVVFLAVALLSGGGLGWLGWQLLRQDAALDVQRQQEAIEQAADRAAAAMQRSSVDLQTLAGTTPDHDRSFPNGVSGVSIAPAGST